MPKGGPNGGTPGNTGNPDPFVNRLARYAKRRRIKAGTLDDAMRVAWDSILLNDHLRNEALSSGEVDYVAENFLGRHAVSLFDRLRQPSHCRSGMTTVAYGRRRGRPLRWSVGRASHATPDSGGPSPPYTLPTECINPTIYKHHDNR